MDSNRKTEKLEKRQIHITHVVNPHRFWFKYSDAPGKNSDEIENVLQKYAKENGNRVKVKNQEKYRSEIIVGVFWESKQKWIRAEVDVADESTDFENAIIVWAIDYGFPMKTSLDLVIILSNELKKLCYDMPTDLIQGGIYGIMPASTKMDAFHQKKILQSNKWDPKPATVLEHMRLQSKIILYFEKKFDTKNHVFGVLEIKHADNVRQLGSIFVHELKMAMELSPTKFERDIVGNSLIQADRWLDDAGDIKCIENRCVSSKTGQTQRSSVSSVNSSKLISNSTTTEEQKSEPCKIDQHKLLGKFTRIQLLTEKKEKEEQNVVSSISKSSDSASVKASTKSKSMKFSTENYKTSTLSASSERVQLNEINEAKLVNKIKLTPILLRNNDEEPNEIQAANFTNSIHRGLRNMDLKETYATQAYAWPNLLRGNSLVLVDSQNKGKTVAYLPALCSMIQRTYDEQEKINGKVRSKLGTTAIIVTSNVPKIAAMCQKLLQMPSFVSNVVEAIGTRDTVNVTIKLYNGCNILVTTAPCLQELLLKSAYAIKTDKLKCVAFENIDVNMEKHGEICNYIVKELCLRKSYKGDTRQFIVTSRTWQRYLFKFMNENIIADSVLVIGNYLEAAFYAGVSLHFRLCQSEVKLNFLIDHLQNIPIHSERTMIICNEIDEAEQVAKHLELKKIPYEFTKEMDSNYAQTRVKSFWEKMEGVLICTDNHLNSIRINNAQHILHFTLPTQQFVIFLNRFSAMLDFYTTTESSEETVRKASATVFFDDNNLGQLPKLVDLLTRDGQSIPKQLAELSQHARILRNKEKATTIRYVSICNMLFVHGIYEHQAHEQCDYRHLLLPTDHLADDTKQISSGQLRFNVLKVISPTEYIIQPTVHAAGQNEKWQMINSTDEFDNFYKKLQAHYKDEGNQSKLNCLELGEKCVVIALQKFHRAEIIRIIEKKSLTDTDKYEVRFIDAGDVELRHAFELYTLDNGFQDFPNQAHHLHLVGVIPSDKEDDWDKRVCGKIKNYLMNHFHEDNLVYEANVLFSLRNTFVVDIMRLINYKRGIVHCSIKRYLENEGFGKYSNSSRQKVLEMAKKHGIKLSKSTKESAKPAKLNVDSVKSSPKHGIPDNIESSLGQSSGCEQNNDLSMVSDESKSEKLSCDDEYIEKWACPWKLQHQNVVITQFYSPTNFYITQSPEKLKQIYDAINEYAEINIETKLDDSMEQPDVYKYCLANVDDEYYRAKVIEVMYDEVITLKVLLVDTGLVKFVEIGKVYDIPDNLVQMLAFQAIWCNMVGIKSIDGENQAQWPEEMVDKIYDAIDEYGDELVLHTVCSNRSIKSDIMDVNCAQHDIVLLAVRDGVQFNMNEMLVERGLVEFDPNTKSKLEYVPNVAKINNDSECGSDWEAECDEYKRTKLNEPKENEPDHGLDWLDDVPPEEFEDFMADLMGRMGLSEAKNDIQQAQTQTQPSITTNPKHTIEDAGPASNGGYNSNESHYDSSPDAVSGAVNDEIIEDPKDKAMLHYIYKRPRVYWWQDEQSIVLKISADDDVKYGLKITSETLIYGTIQNDEQILAIINFFGDVDSEKVSHEIRGLNVIVRLHKLCPILWPHIMRSDTKCSWLLNNVDAIKDDPLYENVVDKYKNQTEIDDSDDEIEEKQTPIYSYLEEDEYLFGDDDSENASH